MIGRRRPRETADLYLYAENFIGNAPLIRSARFFRRVLLSSVRRAENFCSQRSFVHLRKNFCSQRSFVHLRKNFRSGRSPLTAKIFIRPDRLCVTIRIFIGAVVSSSASKKFDFIDPSSVRTFLPCSRRLLLVC